MFKAEIPFSIYELPKIDYVNSLVAQHVMKWTPWLEGDHVLWEGEDGELTGYRDGWFNGYPDYGTKAFIPLLSREDNDLMLAKINKDFGIKIEIEIDKGFKYSGYRFNLIKNDELLFVYENADEFHGLCICALAIAVGYDSGQNEFYWRTLNHVDE